MGNSTLFNARASGESTSDSILGVICAYLSLIEPQPCIIYANTISNLTNDRSGWRLPILKMKKRSFTIICDGIKITKDIDDHLAYCRSGLSALPIYTKTRDNMFVNSSFLLSNASFRSLPLSKPGPIYDCRCSLQMFFLSFLCSSLRRSLFS